MITGNDTITNITIHFQHKHPFGSNKEQNISLKKKKIKILNGQKAYKFIFSKIPTTFGSTKFTH
jgi:hypothetical protein